ncbi:chaperone EMC4 [Spizellomyces punctatus DAOM BR117]|uniref:ER membrane protein complex subunit 4 n=1 Tax=Spizellomyces punctatus (strain DAOM BR117) TaxID=645134 RepID=A0A0L0HLF3_SPIPD|nr:chaperone EMC4 [Spizellomyces punctatus DAOM BR117]KND01888.1 hypothetical protein SPPG_09128 [Spizellomyces punctatus DAOM BR117]|eukprot:XP_016609927.1 hypothetical protein SPPG_09128 [Spizellomyces punctatus DAOM BR117]
MTSKALWTFNLTGSDTVARGNSRNTKLDPPGFAEAVANDGARISRRGSQDDQQEKEVQIANLKMKKAWDAALAPGKSIPMNAIMLYMSGNSIQIFSVLVTVMLLWNSIKAIMGVNTVFDRFSTKSTETRPRGIAALLALSSDPLLLPKLAYIVLQFGCLALGVWKCGAMGLLPTAHSDWLAFMEPKKILEYGVGGSLESHTS